MFFTVPACLLLACGICMLDDAMFLLVGATTLMMGIVSLGANRLLAAAVGTGARRSKG